ncbi:molybdenum cofactor guanylyltransferase [Rhodobacter veldkampii DSM 11550]|uniref:Molybdenum cofactor guanylyltransferase n=1 Tax=Phaeovulum veldkampii DSM 11550 TaxID=1185920 RepID=A0A2T4JIR8_9RHOB|nr:molybdenum cofactor guanylyltransferase MobA [Phaeovulum veldkampii]MBK5947511.1 molybdenum cofactor guanylyltransferase [Phaeovulum veldkampii DSM 11550]NCU20394.1 molybdenum cofactor guanylyltransferase [Candidatus Falkowbacteria bacterium]PTE17811.1 molybdenum cofactor guanylyltransferase [Phaeovulum veldkampii DSM 11550]TDQ63358.1 molybdenum cofactor guanylyltransferase [Phaeovulum veldkampii DSM 11550]
MKIAGLILAGGQSRRMGADKALLRLAGQPLLARVASLLAPQVAVLALSGGSAPARLAGFGWPVLPDPPGLAGQGPLAGVLAGLDWAVAQGAVALVTVPVDTPFLPADLVTRLTDVGGAAFAESRGRDHPTVALWPVTARSALVARLDTGERRLRAALDGAARVSFAGTPDPFFNLNTPEDLASAEDWVREAAPW